MMEDGVYRGRPKVRPQLIIHGGAGNIRPENFPPAKYNQYRDALISIVERTHAFMASPAQTNNAADKAKRPSALDIATFAVQLLEDNPLFNSGHGAVFTRDGLNELEASVMVSRGFKKCGVGVMGLRRVRNPILLARRMLEHGERDLVGPRASSLDVPSAQGHSQLHGPTAEQLAEQYGLDMVHQSYFFTQQRWDEHIRALERERSGSGSATWSAAEYLPQGTCGAVALDEDGVVCVATSTGGMTNKLTGRIGDTPTLGAGFWAEEWEEHGDPTEPDASKKQREPSRGPVISLGDALKAMLADCFPTIRSYAPLLPATSAPPPAAMTLRSVAASGTGNGDSFLRINAVRTLAARARFKPEPSATAATQIAGPGGELERSAGPRWQRSGTGEGEGGVIGVECAVVRDAQGRAVDLRSSVFMDFNCGGMFRAWFDDARGEPVMSIWTNGGPDDGRLVVD